MHWKTSNRFDKRALPIADRHYNRRTPGSNQFVPPGRCVVFLSVKEDALWVTSWPFAEYVWHDWPGAWINSLFRNEGEALSSTLIREAVAATRYYWPKVPKDGLVTFINPKYVRPIKRRGEDLYGYSYIKAGFVRAVPPETKGGLLAFQLLPGSMPEPQPPINAQLSFME